MSEYLLIAESAIFKNNKLTCINIYDNFSAVALPADFAFDLVVICGPNWTPGEHKISIKAKTNGEKVVEIGNIVANIPHENFIYNAIAQDLKIRADYGIQSLTFMVFDGENQIIERTYPIRSLLVPAPKNQENPEGANQENTNQQAPEGENQENNN